MQVAKFDWLGITKCRTKQEIIYVIANHEKAYHLWIKICITQPGMNIALWERITHHFEIETIYIMTDNSYKLVVNNMNIKIQSLLYVMQALPSSNKVLSCINLTMSPKYFSFTLQISSKYLQLYAILPMHNKLWLL